MRLGNILGKWFIKEMEAWDSDYLNAEERAYIQFEKGGQGSFQFGYVQGYFHGRVYKYAGIGERFEFTWEGSDESDTVFGYGWVKRTGIGAITGEIRFHGGEESTFEATPEGYKKSLDVYNIKNREERIATIIGNSRLILNTKTLQRYLNFIQEHISLPYRVTVVNRSFSYSDYGNQTPSGEEIFEILKFEEDVENYTTLFVKVKCLGDEGGNLSVSTL